MAFGRIFQTKEERRIAKMEKEKRERSNADGEACTALSGKPVAMTIIRI